MLQESDMPRIVTHRCWKKFFYFCRSPVITCLFVVNNVVDKKIVMAKNDHSMMLIDSFPEKMQIVLKANILEFEEAVILLLLTFILKKKNKIDWIWIQFQKLIKIMKTW